MQLNFKNKTVLITGATRGIGKQLAKDFEKLGANLILTGTKPEQINNLNRFLKKNKKKKIKYYCLDFLQKGSLDAFLQELKKYPKIDVCINNAGIGRNKPLDKTLIKDWDDILNVNLKSAFILCREVSKLMKKNRYGRIVNIASILGVISIAGRAIYTSSKSGLIGLTRSIALELAPYNVLANCVSPGFVLTDLTQKNLTKKEIKRLTSLVPIKRMAAPQDMSGAVLFLASNLNTYIVGQNLIVDGGYVNV